MYFVRRWLAIGKYAETINLALLQFHGINAMLQLAASIPQPHIVSLYLPIEDGKPTPNNLLERGIRFIRNQQADGKIVLSACGAGISRSTTFAIGTLMEEENLSLFEAYRQILKHHPSAQPHFRLCHSLARYYGLNLSQREIINTLYRIQRDTHAPL